MIDHVRSIASAKSSTLVLFGYCLLVSPLLSFLGYAIDTGAIMPTGYRTDQLQTVSSHLQVAAVCNALLMVESIITLVTIVRKCQFFMLYRLSACFFIVGRFAVVLLILYDGLIDSQRLATTSSQLLRLGFYAALLGLFEIMIVGLQFGTICGLRRKLQVLAKQAEEEV